MPEHEGLADVVARQIDEQLPRLVKVAIQQADGAAPVLHTDVGETLAAALVRLLDTSPPQGGPAMEALDLLPPRAHPVLGPLALALTERIVALYRGPSSPGSGCLMSRTWRSC